MCLDDGAGDGQAEAAAALTPRAAPVAAIEPLEDSLQLIRRDSRSRVADRDLDAASAG
jgi:hypothetical protein